MCFLYSQSSEEEDTVTSKRNSVALNGSFTPFTEPDSSTEGRQSKAYPLQRIISIEEDHLPQFLDSQQERALNNWQEEDEKKENENKVEQVLEETLPSSPRGQPVGKETLPSVRLM